VYVLVGGMSGCGAKKVKISVLDEESLEEGVAEPVEVDDDVEG